jgi:hypothetical protein
MINRGITHGQRVLAMMSQWALKILTGSVSGIDEENFVVLIYVAVISSSTKLLKYKIKSYFGFN